MNYVIAVCLAYMLIIFLTIAVQLLRASRKERLKQIKGFKKGKFALIYIALVPLFYLAYRHNGLGVDGSIWQALNSSVESVVLKYHYSDTASLMSANLFYKITMQTGYALITLNAIMFTISFIGQLVLNLISSFITRKFRKKAVIVIGYNPESLDILKSIEKRHGKAVIMDKLTQSVRDDAFVCHADCIHLSDDDDLGQRIAKLFKKFNKKKVYLILNCEDDALSLRYVKQLTKMIDEKHLTDLPITEPYGLQAYVFASKTNESTFSHYEEASYGLIKFINRHEQIAMDFIEKHPMTEYMTEKQLDYATATVKPEVNLNVVMVGFGNLNETLFLTSVSNNQFMTLERGKLVPKAIHYHLYDRNYPAGKIVKENTSVHSRSLNHGYMRYSAFLKANSSHKENYLELIDEPAKIHFHPCDVSHPDFYTSLQETLNGENSYSFVIVSFGTDIENIELAEKLQQKLKEWNTSPFVKIFVKVRDKKLIDEIKDDFTGDLIAFFGTNKDTVYNATKILGEEMATMARMRHLIYMSEGLKRNNKEFTQEELERLARKKWYFEYRQFQRESNIFACLSTRMKLQLSGYDYARDGEDCTEEFEAEYEKNDRRTPSQFKIGEKTVWDYCNAEQSAHSLRRSYAVQEHQRWCANMICNGIIPSDKQEIKRSGGRVAEKRLHGNLTTMDGLVEYRKIVAEATGKSLEETDVIRYDYQLMDDIAWMLHMCGYKLIKRK